MRLRHKNLSPFLLAAGLLCGAATLGAQEAPWLGPWGRGVRPSLEGLCEAGNGWDVAPCATAVAQTLLSPELKAKLERRLIDAAKERVEDARTADDAMAAPAMWAYRTKKGEVLSDAGGSFALERWPCHLFKGRACFAGIFAGKRTVGAGVGVGLRKMGAAQSFQLVAFAAFVVPYDEPEVSFSPAVGFALKF